MKASFLTKHSRSPLADIQGAAKGGKSTKKHRSELAIALPLTSLIDAFSIIVIYLLIGTQSGGIETPIPNQMELPKAIAGQTLDKEISIIKVENNTYSINNEPVTARTMGAKLFSLKKSLGSSIGANGQDMEIMIQADRKLEYTELSPILKAAAEAGIQKIKFAVIADK